MSARPLERHAVRVLMRRSENRQARWRNARWELLAVLPDPEPPMERLRRRVHDADGQHDFEWTGLYVPLYRDAAESYWYNLVGREPSLFVICRPGQDIDLEPFGVSANYDEAGAHLETDDSVFSAPLSAVLATELERFVMAHYKPAEPKKRRRRNWAAETEHDPRQE